MSSRTVLLARGAFNVLFGLGSWVWLLTHDGQRLARGGTYALIDGLFGALLAFTLYRSSDARWLSVLAVCDGLIRLLIGSLMLANPGMERMILGGAVFMTGIILACSALGLGGMAYALMHGARSNSEDRVAMALPAFLISMFTLLLGVGLAVGLMDERQRIMLSCYALALGAVLLWAGWRAGRRPKWSPTNG
ncbi:hypothetical protein WKW79_36755 [Variovorax robiniae]|uniref:Uncharacterized protein n=1 Tax=Variovorax robiniae TaxID=1836199 RepID=A0ABU8XJS6_9BURK